MGLTEKIMTPRERLDSALNHKQPDMVCVDFGGTAVTGIHASALTKLRRAVLGHDSYRVRIIEPYQMLGEIDDELRQALGIDVIGLWSTKTIFGFDNADWKPFTLFDGTEVLVPGEFNVVKGQNGDLFIYPEGDTSAPPSGKMPKGGFFFDSVIRQQPIDEEKLSPDDNCEEFALLGEEDIQGFARRSEELSKHTEYGVIIGLPGTGIGDIALVPAPFLKQPKGIRDIEEWYVSLMTRKDYLHKVFLFQTEITVENIRRLGRAVGDRVQAAMVCGTDFGTQRGPFISLETYRELFSPYYKRINGAIHKYTNWKTFKHSCGSIFEFIPDLIKDGFDILNPVQCSAANMEPEILKKTFGNQIVFWGGGVDTQKTLPFGTPDEVYRQVRERIEIFNDGGGFIFNAIHNIQANTPVENMLALFRAIKKIAN